MKPPYTHSILLFFFLVFSACNYEKKEDFALPEKASDSAKFYFKRGLKASTPEEMIKDFDTGLAALKDENDSILLYLLDGKIYAYNRLKVYDSSKYLAEKLRKAATFQQDTSFIAMAYYRKAVISRYQDESVEVYENAFNARQLYLAISDSSRAGRRTLEMAFARHNVTDYSGSQATATEALRYLKPERDSVYLSKAYNVIAMAYREQGFLENAVKEYKNALRFSTSAGDSLSYLHNIALVYKDKEKYDKAIDVFEEVLAKVKASDVQSRARFMDNLAYTRWLRDPGIAVEKDLLSALELRLENGENDGLLASYSHLTDYFKEKDSAKANTYAREWLAAARKLSSPTAERKALTNLIGLLPAADREKYVDRYIVLNDSLNDAGLRAKNLFAKIKYDEERKQQEIFSLETLTTRQALEAQRLRSQSLVGILLALLLILSLFFLIYYLRQRHKKEKVKEVHNTESRIAKKIHDELANDIYNVMSRMELRAGEEEMDQLENIYARTRDISRENSPVNTGPGYAENLIATLANITPKNTKLILRGQEVLRQKKIAAEKKIVIYRVLQEFMVNMKKHSGASLVAIIFSSEGKNLRISYSDNGNGFEPDKRRTGSGLQNVENRIFSVNGTITFDSEEGQGLKAEILIPL